MGYLGDLKKTNELAKTMVKCGIATNVVEAQDQIKKKETMLASEAQSDSQAGPLSVEELKEAPKEVAASDARLAEIESFLKRFDPFFAKFHSETTAKIEALTKEVEELKQQLAAVQSVPKDEPVVEEEPKVEEQQTTLDEPEEDKEVRQKDGEYSSDDVSVDKIFNNSNNRLMNR